MLSAGVTGAVFRILQLRAALIRLSAGVTGAQKGGLARAVSWISLLHPGAAIEVWCQDEARLGLIPVLRRVWAPVGERPVAVVERKYEWVYVYGFLHPASGRVIWLLLPRMNAAVMSIALKRFADEAGAGRIVEKGGSN